MRAATSCLNVCTCANTVRGRACAWLTNTVAAVAASLRRLCLDIQASYFSLSWLGDAVHARKWSCCAEVFFNPSAVHVWALRTATARLFKDAARSKIGFLSGGKKKKKKVHCITFINGFFIFPNSLTCYLACSGKTRCLETSSHKFLHHYELFRCFLLDVHISEGRGPLKSNIKYKWDLYEAIFIFSLLPASV